jgi:hypothetical protein
MQFTFNEFKKGTVGKLQTLFLFGIWRVAPER